MPISGIQAFLEILAEFNVRYIFGNPGTSELPLNDALVGDDRFQYILGLQEVPVMSMADGFSMASRTLGVVSLHISCGLGNAMGMLYNAYREGTPLLVTAGQQDRRLQFEEPILGGDMVSVARPWTKWAVEVNRVEDLPTALRRAAQTALTPPTGPVFMSLPMDVQMEISDSLDLSPIRLPDARVRPPKEALQRAAEVLRSANNPGILAGSRVTETDAMQELVSVAELLGAPVMTESGTTHGRLAFPADHPLNGQGLPLWSPEVRERLKEFDVLLVVGMDLLRQYVYHEPSRAIPEHIRLVHIDEDPWQLGKNYPVEVGVIGHTKVSLDELNQELDNSITSDQAAAVRTRTARHVAAHESTRMSLREQIESQRNLRPLTPLGLMGTLSRILPDDVAVIEEAVTTTNTTFERLGVLKNTTGYFGHRGWGLGWGLGCTLGAKLAWPDRPVLGLLGEGAAMYGIQGLWSAARYNIPVTYVICNNACYQILKIGAKGIQLPNALANRYEGLDIRSPEIDYVALATSLGVEAYRISDPDELSERVSESLRENKLQLFDVPIARETPGRLNYG
ncbi:MAG: thiamine pyrophosphate-binding protein [Planctomycetaceae bacterium]|nr:thiamine pyrophosphate-binding protein [Planctomycetales bacterium]MCB9874976.1 thiamine pyrophosphate-binding protein [Planctomycetaceae bacterium]MCB9939370.1 thiamine pyrophosphate-binding protein [Planctomycetaceae bacterium]